MSDKNITTKIILAINWLLGAIYFHIFNWTYIYGKKNIPKESGTLIVASHFTMSDSWLIGICFYLFDIFFKFNIIPYNLPDENNFALKKNKFPKISKLLKWIINLLNLFVGWWFRHSKCIPVNRAAGGRKAHEKIKEVLKTSNVVIFPGSGRRRENQPIKISTSVGKLIYESGAKNIIPIKLAGLPYKGGFFPVIFKKLKIFIGQPIILPQFDDPQNGDYKSITQFVIDSIENLTKENVN